MLRWGCAAVRPTKKGRGTDVTNLATSKPRNPVHSTLFRACDRSSILFEPELHLGRDILVPDRAGWRRERMPVYPDAPHFELPPDWVCEVVSPSTGRLDRVLKMPKYATNGVAHLWLIDPVLKTLEVYRLENARWLLLASHGEDEIVRAEPFDAVDLPLATLWM